MSLIRGFQQKHRKEARKADLNRKFNYLRQKKISSHSDTFEELDSEQNLLREYQQYMARIAQEEQEKCAEEEKRQKEMQEMYRQYLMENGQAVEEKSQMIDQAEQEKQNKHNASAMTQ